MHTLKVRTLAAIAMAGLIGLAQRADAQQAGTAADVTPYAGYLLTGSFLEGPLGTSISSAGGAMYGVQASYPLAPGISVFGNIASSKADLMVGVPFLAGVTVGEVSTLLYDGGIRLALPNTIGTSKSVTPFVQLGVGAVRHALSAASLLELRATNLAVNAGVGAHVKVSDGIGIRVLASDYIGKFDAEEATTFDLSTGTRHNWGLVGGISLSF